MSGTGFAEAVESSRENKKNATDSDQNPSKNVHQDERCHLEGDRGFMCIMDGCLGSLTSILFTMSKFS